MLTREKTLLRILERAGRLASRLDLMKWAFLLAQCPGTDRRARYEFLPYKYGPYSFTLMYDLRKMESAGYITMLDDRMVALPASTSSEQLDDKTEDHLSQMWSLYGTLGTAKLLDAVYEQFPWYTCLSKNSRFAETPSSDPAVYMVGYEDLDVDGFLNLLLRSGIKRIVDVRRNPIARRYGFHKSTVANTAARVSIEYVHIPELGISSDRRSGLAGFASYERLFSWYEEEVIGRNQNLVENLADEMQATTSVLVCQERDPLFCHRSRLAKSIAVRTGLERIDLRSLTWMHRLKERGYL